MNTDRLGLVIAFGLLSVSMATKAQVNDAGAWLGLGLEKKITQAASINVEVESRFGENLSTIDSYFVDASAHYDLTSFLRVSGHYRFSRKHQLELFYRNRHRFNLDATLKHKFENIEVSYRLRGQTQYTSVHSKLDGKVPTNQIRNKLAVNYSFDKPYEPYVWGELFYGISAEQSAMRRARVGAGIKYRVDKRNSLNLAYLVQRDMNRSNPVTDYVLSLNYGFAF